MISRTLIKNCLVLVLVLGNLSC